jgi:hypothetical protein
MDARTPSQGSKARREQVKMEQIQSLHCSIDGKGNFVLL